MAASSATRAALQHPPHATKSFAILMCGWPSPSVVDRFGSFGDMLERLLTTTPSVCQHQKQKDSPAQHNHTYRAFDVECGREMPSDALLREFDGLVLSGSRHSVYDEEKWVDELASLVRSAVARRQKVLGVCYGAQMLAHALGGKVAPAPADIGWEAGARRVDLDVDALRRRAYARGLKFDGGGQEEEDDDDHKAENSHINTTTNCFVRVCELHRDAVEALPAGADLLGSSPRCKHELFALDDHVLAVQGHPEFDHDVVRDIVASRVDLGVISPDEANRALDSLLDVDPPAPTARDNALRRLCQAFLAQ